MAQLFTLRSHQAVDEFEELQRFTGAVDEACRGVREADGVYAYVRARTIATRMVLRLTFCSSGQFEIARDVPAEALPGCVVVAQRALGPLGDGPFLRRRYYVTTAGQRYSQFTKLAETHKVFLVVR